MNDYDVWSAGGREPAEVSLSSATDWASVGASCSRCGAAPQRAPLRGLWVCRACAVRWEHARRTTSEGAASVAAAARSRGNVVR